MVSAELIFQRGKAPHVGYVFKHALVQDVIYSTLLRDRRKQLHTRIAGLLEKQFQDIVAAQPQLLAHHCLEAGLDEKAVSYQLKAGQQAVARSAMTEAVAHLQKGLDRLAAMPECPSRLQQELDLQIARERALMATNGYSAPAVTTSLVRARALAEQLRRADYVLPLLYSQYACHTVRAEHTLALSVATEMQKFGEIHKQKAALVLGRLLEGASSSISGNL